MTSTTATWRTADLDDLLARVERIGPDIAASAARHDVDGSIVDDCIRLVRDAGLLAMAVPVELGGLGATPRQVAAVQRALAHHCGSTALGTAMHQHTVCFATWRYHRGMPGADGALRRVADEGIVFVTTGGADFTRPRGNAVRVDGGYRVSGRKIFASLSAAGDVLSTMFPIGDDGDRRVLNMAVPLRAEGVTVLDNWDTLGMRGTASNDVELDDVFVPDGAVLAERPYGIIDPPLQVVIAIALPIISAVYLGVAEAAYAAALDAAAPKADNPIVQRQVGAIAHRLRVAAWALEGACAAAGDDTDPSMETVAAVSAAKSEIAQAGVDVCDLAMELAGGPSFFKGSVIERCYRDVRAAKFHPFTRENQLVHAGRLALGLPVDEF
jgi:alkylation response protein AidB-like acyl-CoA dehydrogenase